MEKFPNLNSNQVAMVFADPNTGHVLDVKFNLAINKDQSCYLIFNSKIEAVAGREGVESADGGLGRPGAVGRRRRRDGKTSQFVHEDRLSSAKRHAGQSSGT